MKPILIVSIFFLLPTGCSRDINPVSEKEIQYMIGQIFMVGSNSQNGLALICEENNGQMEYWMEFDNKVTEDIAYYNQGKNAKIGYQDIYVSQGFNYLKVKEIEILNN
jgi:hypothetical protein